MKLKSIQIDKRFIPKWNDNQKLPATEQVIIHFARIPATSEKQNYKSFSMSADASMKLNYNDNMLIATFVSKVENLEFDDKKIKDGKDLATASHPKLSALFTEIRDYLFPDDEEAENISEGE